MIDGNRSRTRNIEWNLLVAFYDLYERFSYCMTNRKLVKDIRVSFSEVCYDQRIVDNVLYHLTRDNPWLCDLIGPQRAVATVFHSGRYDVFQNQVGPLSRFRPDLTDWSNHKTRFH
jgi:hypothetical protein